MKFSYFFKKGLLLFLLFALFLILFSVIGIIQNSPAAAWLGLAVGFLNFLAGASIICWGFEKSDKIFYGTFFGSMLARFLLIFLILFIFIELFKFNQYLLVGSLMITYFGFLVLEIWHIWKFSSVRGKHHDV
jgi:hypothetical protein